MGAQSAHEPSMEDILASIRKIISEDSSEDSAQQGVQESAQRSTSENTPSNSSAQSAEPMPHAHSNPPLIAEKPVEQSLIASAGEPPVLQARRELFEKSENGFSSENQPPVFTSTSAPAPNKVTPPPINTTPLRNHRETLASEFASPKAEPTAASKGNMGGHGHFGESDSFEPTSEQSLRPAMSSERPQAGASPTNALHPAIENAKAFVASRQQQGSQITAPPEKPVFTPSQLSEKSSTVNASLKPMVSPETLERRDESERRNHPLRRDADREEQDFKTALTSPAARAIEIPNQDTMPSPVQSANTLMSAQTGDAVSNALDQLKNSAMDNLDGKVEALLRPMLREWLDNNLPSMVERLVRDEIERVSRGN